MATTIRLRRAGSRNHPFFRMVATNERSRRDGPFLEVLGYYNPVKKPYVFEVKEERVLHWVEHGARLSEAVRELLRNHGTLGRWHERRQAARGAGAPQE